MNKLDNELECRARELFAYVDTELAIEECLPFAGSFLVEKMRAAVFAKAARTLEGHRASLQKPVRPYALYSGGASFNVKAQAIEKVKYPAGLGSAVA